MHLSTDHPRAKQPLSIDITVSRSGTPLRADVAYRYVHLEKVVGTGPHYHFYGSVHTVLTWPSLSVGSPLTFRAVVTTGKVKMNLDFPLASS